MAINLEKVRQELGRDVAKQSSEFDFWKGICQILVLNIWNFDDVKSTVAIRKLKIWRFFHLRFVSLMSGFSGYLNSLAEWNATQVIPVKFQSSDGSITEVKFSATTPLKDVATLVFQATGKEPVEWGNLSLLFSVDDSAAEKMMVSVNDNRDEKTVSYEMNLCYGKAIGEVFYEVSNFKVVSITAVKAFDPELEFVQVDAPNPQHSIHEAFGRDIIAFSIDDFEPPTENPEVKIIVKSELFDHHYVLETFADNSVLNLKLFVIAPKCHNEKWDKMDEQNKMAHASVLQVFDKDGKQLEDLAT